jgi:hypothetical protein
LRLRTTMNAVPFGRHFISCCYISEGSFLPFVGNNSSNLNNNFLSFLHLRIKADT